MARNKVQYQKGLSEAGFDRQCGSEEQCRAALAKWRWPDGFVCPRCGGRRHSLIKTRALYQCTACRRQTCAVEQLAAARTLPHLRFDWRQFPLFALVVAHSSGDGLLIRLNDEVLRPAPARTYPAVSGAFGWRSGVVGSSSSSSSIDFTESTAACRPSCC